MVLEFADPLHSPHDGINYDYSFDPGEFSGQVDLLQLVESINRQRQDIHSVWHTYSQYMPGPYLDTSDPYGIIVDSPSLGLPATYLRASAADGFETWLMFTPTGGHRVPLRALNWSWSGSATNSPSGWGRASGGNSPNPTSFETEGYPAWTDNISHSYWTP